uniref:Mlh1_C domain-containing protein n=1 Tax=Echinostoma caproni TaxID=27848 RepID=A0A183BAD5_9TREM
LELLQLSAEQLNEASYSPILGLYHTAVDDSLFLEETLAQLVCHLNQDMWDLDVEETAEAGILDLGKYTFCASFCAHFIRDT